MKMTGKRGLTLIEVIIAMFLIAIVVAALASTYPMVYRYATASKNRMLAKQVVINTVESIKAVPWGKPVPDFIKQDQVFDMLVEGQRHQAAFRIKEIKFEPANTTGNGPDPNRRTSQVTVTVEWTEGTGSSSQGQQKTMTHTGVLSRD